MALESGLAELTFISLSLRTTLFGIIVYLRPSEPYNLRTPLRLNAWHVLSLLFLLYLPLFTPFSPGHYF